MEVLITLPWGAESGSEIARVEAKGVSVIGCTLDRGHSIYGAFFFLFAHVSLSSGLGFFFFKSLLKTGPFDPYLRISLLSFIFVLL